MQDILVSCFTPENISGQFIPLIQLLEKSNKNFNYKDSTILAVVNTNNIDIGIVSLTINESILFVNIYQTPNVCRMSILSLIDSSVVLSQKYCEQLDTIVFQNVHYAHTFKLKQIISDIVQNENDFITNSEKLLSVNMSDVSLKNIILEIN